MNIKALLVTIPIVLIYGIGLGYWDKCRKSQDVKTKKKSFLIGAVLMIIFLIIVSILGYMAKRKMFEMAGY